VKAKSRVVAHQEQRQDTHLLGSELTEHLRIENGELTGHFLSTEKTKKQERTVVRGGLHATCETRRETKEETAKKQKQEEKKKKKKKKKTGSHTRG
jgi:hypothetical protein